MYPLEHISVVAIEQAVAAPLATRHLADLGARVIKVERPGAGDFARGYDRAVHGHSSYFVWLNRGKESVELDLKNGDDRALLSRILGTADVFVQNLIPGAAERLGLGASELRADRPELIHCSISGYGSDGPYRDKKAYDLLVQCEAGLLAATGTPDVMTKPGISVADIATGMNAYAGILAALYERERTGVGATLEVSLIDALGDWMQQPAYYASYGGRATPRTGARHASISPYGPYQVAAGQSIFLGIQNDREWVVFCTEVMGQPQLVDDPRFIHNPERVQNDGVLTEIIEAALAHLTADEAIATLDRANIACARVRNPAELLEHPQLRARGRWLPVQIPSAQVEALAPAVTVEGRDPLMRPVPALGEHNDSIRMEFQP